MTISRRRTTPVARLLGVLFACGVVLCGVLIPAGAQAAYAKSSYSLPRVSYKVKNSSGWMVGSDGRAVGKGKPLYKISVKRPTLLKRTSRKKRAKRVSYALRMKVGVMGSGWKNAPYNKHKTSCVYSGKKGEEIYAVKIRSKKALRKHGYHIYYRVCVKGYGWLGWARDGQAAGTVGIGRPITKIKVKVAKKAPGSVSKRYMKAAKASYRTDVADLGWSGYSSDGKTAGKKQITGKLQRLAVTASIVRYSGSKSKSVRASGIKYCVRTGTDNSKGWTAWRRNGEAAGADGTAKNALRIKLTGKLAKRYNVYYRVYASYHGWLGWAKNGKKAGTGSINYPIGAIQIRIVPKGKKATFASGSKPAYTVKTAGLRVAPNERIAHLAAQLASTVCETTSGDTRDRAITHENPGSKKYNFYADEYYPALYDYYCIHDMIMPGSIKGGVLKYAECAAAVSVVVRAAYDPDFKQSSKTRTGWKRIGACKGSKLASVCKPGDVLFRTDGRHAMLYVGNKIVRRYHPEASSDICIFESGGTVSAYPSLTKATFHGHGNQKFYVCRPTCSLPADRVLSVNLSVYGLENDPQYSDEAHSEAVARVLSHDGRHIDGKAYAGYSEKGTLGSNHPYTYNGKRYNAYWGLCDTLLVRHKSQIAQLGGTRVAN